MTDTQGRLGYEAFELSRVPGSTVQYASRYPAWRPGADLPPGVEEQPTKTRTKKSTTTGVFGGVVYAQAPLAAARAIESEEKQSHAAQKGYMGIHVRKYCHQNSRDTNIVSLYKVYSLLLAILIVPLYTR